jgi:endonuclease YncB( thermonuclease family)
MIDRELVYAKAQAFKDKITGICLGILLFLLMISTGLAAEEITVIDGDTIKVGDRTVRIVGCDTFETHKNKQAYFQANRYMNGDVEAVLRLGNAAKNYAVEYFKNKDRSDIIISFVGEDKYGRTLGIVWGNEINYCEEIIEKGLARNYCGEKKNEGWRQRNLLTKKEWRCKDTKWNTHLIDN